MSQGLRSLNLLLLALLLGEEWSSPKGEEEAPGSRQRLDPVQ